MIDNHEFSEIKAPLPKKSKAKLLLTLIFIFLSVFLVIVASFFIYINTELYKKYPIPWLPIIDQSENQIDESKKRIINIIYQDGEFSPNILTIRKDTTIRFLNQGSDNMWIASNPHPTHTDLFDLDQKSVSRTGESYQYTFTIAGRWEYHNHVLPQATGTIIVWE